MTGTCLTSRSCIHMTSLRPGCAMPAVGSGHEAALKAFQRIVRPAARRFAPDVILVRIAWVIVSEELTPLQRQSDLHALLCDAWHPQSMCPSAVG